MVLEKFSNASFGKLLVGCLREVIQQASKPLQTTAGLQGGAEAATSSTRQIFDQKDTDGVILVDASDAFNSLNRNAALRNIPFIFPEFSTALINTYSLLVWMFMLSRAPPVTTS